MKQLTGNRSCHEDDSGGDTTGAGSGYCSAWACPNRRRRIIEKSGSADAQ